MTTNYKIKMVKVYQAVEFEKGLHSYFTDTEYLGLKTSARPDVTVREQENGSVIIRSSKCMIKIGHANVAYIEYDQLKPLDTDVAEAVKQEQARMAAKAKAEADREANKAAATAKEKADAEALLAKDMEEAKKLRASQKASKNV